MPQIKKQKSKKGKRSQRGGMDQSCTGSQAANIHNTNPQASLDLDGKFNLYGGPVPLGSSIVGGGSVTEGGTCSTGTCGDEGVGTANFKSGTFKNYLEKLSNSYQLPSGGGSCGDKMQKGGGSCGSDKMQKGGGSCGGDKMQKGGGSCGSDKMQKGAGYSTDPTEFIGGQPVIRGYDDKSAPAIIKGGLVFGTPDKPICGLGAIQGGSRQKKKGKKSAKRSGKKSKRSGKKSKKLQMGGDFTTLYRSKPAEFDTAFDGPKGVFNYPDDMSARAFGEFQPNYSVNAV